MPSRRSACITASTESAMISRLTSEKCIPSWPIEMPSDTEMVPNCMGKPPALRTPSVDALARRSSERLHGVISFHDDATPICGFTQSSSPIPTARSMPREADFSRPSVTCQLRGFMFDIRQTYRPTRAVRHSPRVSQRAINRTGHAFDGVPEAPRHHYRLRCVAQSLCWEQSTADGQPATARDR